MNRCDTCRFWTRDATVKAISGREISVQGICGGIGSSWDWRLEDGDPGTELALLVDANAALITRADFGCAAWEASS